MPAAIIFGVCVAVVAAAQTALRQHLSIGDVAPNVVIVLVGCVGLVRGTVTGCGLGLLGGFLLGALQETSMGLEIAGAMMAGFLAGTLRGRIFTERRSVSLPLGVGVVVVAEAVAYVAAPGAPFVQWLQRVALEAAYSAVFALPLYVFVRWVDHLFPGRADEAL